MFKSLKLYTWRQIERIDIQFHPRLTILTGANGSGKTTILNLLSTHFGWSIPLVGTPERDQKTGILRYLTDFWRRLSEREDTSRYIIGQILYDKDEVGSLSIPRNSPNFTVDIQPRVVVKGLHIPSHRPVYTYQPISVIPTQPITREQAFGSYSGAVQGRYMGTGGRTANSVIKETLLALATFGYGNEVVAANPEAQRLFERFQSILREVLPPRVGFTKLRIVMPEVLFTTKSGDFSLDAVSGGIASIIDMAWQIFMGTSGHEPFVVTIDEPENHLHPELQQTILTGLLQAFPNVQFIVATHNPFIISSVPDSSVYVLNYNSANKVESTYLDFVNKSGTANDILRDVLGLPFTLPVWAERKVESIVRKYAQTELTRESFEQLRQDLAQIGLEKLVPEVIGEVVDDQKNL
jgi:predicted ATPase